MISRALLFVSAPVLLCSSHLAAEAQPATAAKAEVKQWRGAPALFVHGEPVGPMAFRGGGESHIMRKMHEAGLRLYLVWWRMLPVRHGFAGLDSVLGKLLESAPDAKFILLVRFVVDAEFAKAYPDAVVRFNDGAAGHFVAPSPKLRPAGVPRYSFASEAWRSQAATRLRALIAHVRQSTYDDRIVGYLIGAGHCGEWLWWCDFNHGRYDLDYSPAMEAAFRRYLRRKYRGSAQRLRQAWREDAATFESATVPTLKRRQSPSLGDFFDPVADAPVRDYAECHSAVVTDSILQLAKTAKEADARRTPVGLFYGGLQCINYLWGGQADYGRVLDSPDIDFLASPFPYENRGVGDHASLRFLMGSLRLRNKLWFAEADDRTCFSEPFQRCYGAPDNLPDSIEMLWRDFGHITAASVQGWWTCFGPKWFDHPDILAAFRRMQGISRQSLKRPQRAGLPAKPWDRSSNSEVAVLIHRPSLLACRSKLTALCIDRARIHEWGRLGTMPDYFDLGDVGRPELRRYKMFILPNAFSLAAAERRTIDQHLKRDGKVLVWIHAPGIIRPDATPAWSPRHCADLMGMAIEGTRGRKPAAMVLAPSNDPLLRGLPRGMRFGSFTRPVTSGPGITPDRPQRLGPVTLDPRFHVVDRDAVPLAHYVDTKEVGFAIKRFDNWTSVFIGSPAAPAIVLRRLAKMAGVHLYLDTDDVVYHNASVLVVHTAEAGKREIRFPKRSRVVDLRTGKQLAASADRLAIDMPARRTLLLRVHAVRNP